MPKLTKITLLVLVFLFLPGCFHILYRPTVQQGNVISQDAVSQLRPGMTEDQVRYLMGTPLLVNTFEPNRWDYVYTFKKNNEPRQQQHVTLIFVNGIVRSIQVSPLVMVK